LKLRGGENGEKADCEYLRGKSPGLIEAVTTATRANLPATPHISGAKAPASLKQGRGFRGVLEYKYLRGKSPGLIGRP